MSVGPPCPCPLHHSGFGNLAADAELEAKQGVCGIGHRLGLWRAADQALAILAEGRTERRGLVRAPSAFSDHFEVLPS